MNHLDKNFWNNKYIDKTTQWDLGQVSPPLKNYIDQLNNLNQKILIPGCGNAYEAEYLLNMGFIDVTLIDIATNLVQQLQTKFKDNAQIKIIEDDFFKHQGKYDLILEQTFFCALDPKLRPAYAKQMHELLNEKAKLVGVLFNREFEADGPPFGGSKEEYQEYFQPYFNILKSDLCYNSYSKRANTELFIIFQKK